MEFNKGQTYNSPPPGEYILTSYDYKHIRHNKEMILYRIMQVINILFVIGVVLFFIFKFDSNIKKVESTYSKVTIAQNAGDSMSSQEILDKIPQNVQFLLLIIIMGPYLVLVMAYLYGQVRARSVKITERQFPEVYQLIQMYAWRMGLKEVPEAYLVQENGVLNAFSAFVIRKKYIQINADLFEVAYREYNDLNAIGFVVAHEMAHIRLKHASLWYNLSIIWGSIIPFLGSALSRAREYSCDRVAQVVSGSDGIDAMMALTVGKHLYKRINVQDYIDNSMQVRGFFVWAYNLTASHPIMTKRIKALILRDRSGELL